MCVFKINLLSNFWSSKVKMCQYFGLKSKLLKICAFKINLLPNFWSSNGQNVSIFWIKVKTYTNICCIIQHDYYSYLITHNSNKKLFIISYKVHNIYKIIKSCIFLFVYSAKDMNLIESMFSTQSQYQATSPY